MNMHIERIGWIGDSVLGGNLFMWSLLILFFFTALVSLVYYKRNLTFLHIHIQYQKQTVSQQKYIEF